MIRLIQRRLIIPRGDTGSFTVPLIAAANTGDAAVFTIFSLATHKKIFTKVVTIEEDPITIEFTHGETVNLPVGRYVWDIKYYRNPVIENDVLINGDEITSYYAAFELPICEIRETGDVLLTADNAPTSLVAPEYLNIIDAALSNVNANKTAAETAATSAQAAAEAAEQSLNDFKNLSITAATLQSDQDATASYNFDTGILTLGIPRGQVGNGVSSVLLNNDYTLTVDFTDGTSTTVGPIRGEKGDTGEIPTEWKDELDSVAVDVENLATVANTGSYNDLSNKPFIPTRVSDLTDDSGHYTKPSGGIPAADLAETYITTETDPTVPAWAKAAQKPTYTASEVGATTEQQVSSMIASAIGDIHSFDMAAVQALPTTDISTHTIYLVPKTGETNDVYDEYIYINDAWEMVGNTQVDLSNYALKSELPTKTSDLTNDSGFLTSYTETDPTVPQWAKAATKPSYTATEVGALPTNTHIPSTTAELTNDAGFITDADVPVKSVNGQIGDVQIDAVDYTNEQNLTAAQQAMALANLGLNSSNVETGNDLYGYRAVSGGNKVKIDKVIGGTVAWNQLAPNNWSQKGRGRFAFPAGTRFVNGHRYLIFAKRDINTESIKLALYTNSSSGTVTIFDIVSPFNVDGALYIAVIRTALSDGLSDGTATPSATGGLWGHISSSTDTTVSGLQIFDLTQMFGSAVADYIYGLETATAGAGVAFFRSLFPDAYYPYNAGELVSVAATGRKTVGFNLWDEEWEVGTISSNTGANISSALSIRAKNQIPVLAGKTYCLSSESYHYSGAVANLCVYYDASGNFVSSAIIGQTDTKTFTVPQDVAYMRFVKVYYIEANGTYKHDICLNISDPTRDGTYEPYSAHTYPLDSTLTLRGIPVVTDDDKVVYDGDQYTPDGTVTRRYGIVDLGTLTWTRNNTNGAGDNAYKYTAGDLASSIRLAENNDNLTTWIIVSAGNLSPNNANNVHRGFNGTIAVDTIGNVQISDEFTGTASEFKTHISGVYLVYELATPTTETANPYQSLQIAGSTEEFIDAGDRDITMPVGVTAGYYNATTIDLDIDVGVQDVQVNGTSVVSNGVANIPIATASSGNYGVTRIVSDNGVGEANGALSVVKASDSQIITGTNNYRPIVSGTQHKAVFYGLAKAAGVTSNVATPIDSFTAYTAAAKGAIQKMLGVTDLFGNEENGITASRAYALGEAFAANGKLYRATAAIAQDGAIVTDGSGANCVEISVAGDFVKKTDIANSTTPGVMKVTTGGLGLVINADKVLQISPADAATIKDGTQGYRPITPQRQHESVFYGLAKAAGTDMKSSSNAVGTYTDTAKTAIKSMLGITDSFPATSSLTDDFYSVKVTNGTSTLVKETFDARAYGADAGGTGGVINVELQRNQRLVYGEMLDIQIMTVPSYGLCGFTFISGSTPTVLTLPDTVVMPEWWIGAEANRRYDIMFLDGHGAVMSWPL